MMAATRELYWNVSFPWLMYPFFILSLAVFIYGIYSRIKLWKKGQPLSQKKARTTGKKMRFKPNGQRAITFWLEVLCQRRIFRNLYPGIMHAAIFWGFIIFLAGTLTISVQDHLHIPLFQGKFYLALSFCLDIFGLFAIGGIMLAAYRRCILKPEKLDYTWDDLITLGLIFIILTSGFILEGLRIAGTQDPWANWSPVGKAISLLFTSLSLPVIIRIYQIVWWAHLVLALGFVAYLPYSKLLHVLTSPVSILCYRSQSEGALSLIDFEDETVQRYGIGETGDFTWKQLMDTSSCTRCGRCQDNCPAYLTAKPLSPKENIKAIKAQLESGETSGLGKIRKVLRTNDSKEYQKKYYSLVIGNLLEKIRRCPSNHTRDEKKEIAAVSVSWLDDLREGLWSCTTCGSCEEQCPVHIEHLNMTIGGRRHLVLMEDDYPSEFKTVYRNLENNGNPWGIGWAERADWVRKFDIEIANTKEEADYLYWVGCAGSFDPRNQRVVAAVCRLLQAAGIPFVTLEGEEKCCGDPARRTGNEYLYQILAKENIENIQKARIKKVITSCPHCYHTLANEYPLLGAGFEVIHHTELLAQLVRAGRIPLHEFQESQGTVAYHDSCYLGRYNGIFQEPRNVLKHIPGLSLKEVKNKKEKSFCCGAGGGRMWLEEGQGHRINEKRTEEFMDCGVHRIAAACPFCLTMLEDGLKTMKNEDMTVADISEILWQACTKNVSGGERI